MKKEGLLLSLSKALFQPRSLFTVPAYHKFQMYRSLEDYKKYTIMELSEEQKVNYIQQYMNDRKDTITVDENTILDQIVNNKDIFQKVVFIKDGSYVSHRILLNDSGIRIENGDHKIPSFSSMNLLERFSHIITSDYPALIIQYPKIIKRSGVGV